MKITPAKSVIALIVSALLAGIAALFASGCTTAVTPRTQLFVGFASDAAAIVLTKNPKAVPAVRALLLGIDAVLTEKSLPPEKVKAFLDLLGKDANLTPEERLLFGRAIQRTHEALVAYVGTPDLQLSDPRVRAVLTEVKRNLDDTLALHDALKS